MLLSLSCGGVQTYVNAPSAQIAEVALLSEVATHPVLAAVGAD